MLLATQDELLQYGYADLSVQRIAARARVNKTTIYRRWKHREGIISDLIAVMAETSVPIPNTGDFTKDLHAFAHELTRVLNGRSGHTIRALLAAAAGDPALQDQLTLFYETRYTAAEAIVVRAIDRGEVRQSVIAAHVIGTLAGPLYYSLTVLGRPPTPDDTIHALIAAHAYARYPLENPRHREHTSARTATLTGARPG